jgi:hypothetical protein
MENFNEAGDAMFSVKAAEMPRRPRKVSKVITVLSFGIQGVALAFGPLALVQPLVATEVLFALPMIARRNRPRSGGKASSAGSASHQEWPSSSQCRRHQAE